MGLEECRKEALLNQMALEECRKKGSVTYSHILYVKRQFIVGLKAFAHYASPNQVLTFGTVVNGERQWLAHSLNKERYVLVRRGNPFINDTAPGQLVTAHVCG